MFRAASSHDGSGLNLKISGIFFQVFALVSQIKSEKIVLAILIFFQNSFDFLSLVV